MIKPFFVACPLCGEAAAKTVASFAELVFASCSGCHLVYKQAQAPKLGEGYGAAYFEQGPAKYLKRFSHRVAKCRRQLLAALELTPNAVDALDVGCSAGYMMQAAASIGLRGQGVDLSSFAVEACKERGLQAQVGSMESLPYPDNSFDIVTAKHVLEHSCAPKVALAEIVRILRPGGTALLIVPDAAYWKRYLMPKAGRYFSPHELGWQHHIYYGTSQLQAMAQTAGLVACVGGKPIFRRRLAQGLRYLFEAVRFASVWLGCRLAAVTHTRKEIQLLAQKPAKRNMGGASGAPVRSAG